MVQKLKVNLEKLSGLVWSLIESIFASLRVYLSDQNKAVTLAVVVVLALDLILKGSMGVIQFLISQFKSFFDILKSPDLNTIVMCLLAFLIYDKITNKK